MKNPTEVPRITVPFNNLLEQSRLAEWEHYLFIYILDNLRAKYPGVKVTRIQDSWTFEGDSNQCQLLLDDIKEEVKKRKYGHEDQKNP